MSRLIAFGFFPQPVAPVWAGSSLETSHLWEIISRNLHSGSTYRIWEFRFSKDSPGLKKSKLHGNCLRSNSLNNSLLSYTNLSFFSPLYAFNKEISKILSLIQFLDSSWPPMPNQKESSKHQWLGFLWARDVQFLTVLINESNQNE